MKLNQIYINCHLGLGDNIVVNGLCRKIAKSNPSYNIVVPTWEHNTLNVKYMFRDISNISVIAVQNNTSFININYSQIINANIPNTLSYDEYYDDVFYLAAGENPSVKQSHFYIERDNILEDQTYINLIGNKFNEYIFLHEKDDIKIDRNKLPKLPIITAHKNIPIFSLLKIMEHAHSCHLIPSCFISLMMCKKYCKNVYAHMYTDRQNLTNYIKSHNIQIIN